MTDPDRYLRRKWTMRAHGNKVIFNKYSSEKSEHVYMKIFLWALYLPFYEDMLVEYRIGDRYKPDVVSLDAGGSPLFWGESGYVGKVKIETLAKRYRHTHFAIAKWDTNLDPYANIVTKAVKGLKRTAPFDLIRFYPGDEERFIDDEGNVSLTHEDIKWVSIS